MNNLVAEYFRSSALVLPGTNPNRAPMWVFALLGAVIAIAALVLYFTTSVGGGEQDYLYADPTNDYFGSPGTAWTAGYGPFGGFTRL
jgi:hypothetical protein